MQLIDRLTADMRSAMKQRDQRTVGVIRCLKAAIQNVEIEQRVSLTDEVVTDVLIRELKIRNEARSLYAQAGREEQVAAVDEEIAVVQKYLPQPMDEQAIAQVVAETIQQVGAQSKKDIGKVMAVLLPQVRGRADGQIVQTMVMNQLS